MKISPVSFGSIMLFQLKDGRPKIDIPTIMETAFQRNNALIGYNLSEIQIIDDDRIDYSINNSSAVFSENLDNRYREELDKYHDRIFFSEANFVYTPKNVEKRYFITAHNDEEERYLQSIFQLDRSLYAVRCFKN